MLKKELLIELSDYVESRIQMPVLLRLQAEECLSEAKLSIDIEDFIKIKQRPPFNEILFKLIAEKGVRDSDIYKKAGIDRRHFSKIRTNPKYHVSKNTAIALAFALELNTDEAEGFLSAAGYSLSDSETFDLVIQFCFEKEIYSVDEVNQALDYFSLKPLFGVLE